MTYQLAVPLSQGSDDVVVFEVDADELPDDLVREMLVDLSPDETTVTFGLKVGGEYGVVIAKGTAEVNFSIQMSWKSD